MPKCMSMCVSVCLLVNWRHDHHHQPSTALWELANSRPPFPEVVFPPFLLTALSSSPFYCALQGGFGKTWWTGDMTIPLQFVSLYDGQEVFVDIQPEEDIAEKELRWWKTIKKKRKKTTLLLLLLPITITLVQMCCSLFMFDVVLSCSFCLCAPQWGATDAEIKVPSCENTELK